MQYVLRRSRRAKRIGLQVKPGIGLVLILPAGVSEHEGQRFIEANQAWVDQQMADFSPPSSALPTTIQLDAIPIQVEVAFEYALLKRPRLYTSPGKLLLVGEKATLNVFQSLLKQWLRSQAYEHLLPRFKQLSESIGLPYKLLRFRAQTSRWGSCSSEGRINLNDNLLCLAPELVRYVMVHELCHTMHMDHSAQFWALVARFEPNYQWQRDALKCVNLPDWLVGLRC